MKFCDKFVNVLNRSVHLTAHFFIVFFVFACSENNTEVPPVTPPPTELDQSKLLKNIILDFGNKQNVSDIYVGLAVSVDKRNMEGRLLISKLSTLAPEDLVNVPKDHYLSLGIVSSTLSIQQQLPETLADIEGEPIKAGTYYLYLILVREDKSTGKVFGPYSVSLANASIFKGNYVGTWSDNLYTNFPISARIESDTRGIFYYSPTFKACCGGDDDGKITFNIENKEVKAFTYNQKLGSFMGGNCIGVYEGTGVITLDEGIRFEIDYAGTDCEGPHTGGRIVMTRQ